VSVGAIPEALSTTLGAITVCPSRMNTPVIYCEMHSPEWFQSWKNAKRNAWPKSIDVSGSLWRRIESLAYGVVLREKDGPDLDDSDVEEVNLRDFRVEEVVEEEKEDEDPQGDLTSGEHSGPGQVIRRWETMIYNRHICYCKYGDLRVG
jgi:hypothetical protein